MATAMDPKLVALKKRDKSKKTRKVMLGNPEMIRVPLLIDKTTGRVKNLDGLKKTVESAELPDLRELFESLLGTKTKAKKKATLIGKICKHLDAVAEGYVEAAADEAPEALAEAAGKTETPAAVATKVVSGKGTTEDEGGSWDWVYKGATFTLTCIGYKQYPLAGPNGHPAVGGIYTSPSDAVKTITGSKAEVNGRTRFGMPASKRAKPGQGDGKRRAYRKKLMRVRDPRLPMPGERFIKVHGSVEYTCTMRDDDSVLVEADELEPTIYSSVSSAATEIGGSNESGFRFFRFNHDADQLDFVKAIVGFFVSDGLSVEDFLNGIEERIEAANQSADATKTANLLAREFYKRSAIKKLIANIKSSDDA